MELMMDAFLANIQWWWILPIGVTIGVFVGAVPGFSSTNTLIILLPLTLGMETAPALAFMSSVYIGSHMGGSVPAILLNVPGTGSAATTCFDGYPMNQQGKGQQALVIAFAASCIGGLLTTTITLGALPALRSLVYYFGSIESFVIILFGLVLIAQISGKDPIKGFLAGLTGLLIGAIGYDTVYSVPRATFGLIELFDGVPSVPAIIGLFAISEVFIMINKNTIIKGGLTSVGSGWQNTIEGLKMTIKYKWAVVRAAFIGFIIGIIPGAGATIATFVSYQQNRSFSKEPEKFGTGHPEGVIAAEAANNGLTSGSLIPLLSLGIPGGGTAAVMLIVLQAHGVPIGPRLFQVNPLLAYSIVMAMWLAYYVLIAVGLPLTKIMSRTAFISTKILAPTIITFTLVGAFVERRFFFDMQLALLFGIIGFIMKKTGYSVHAMLLGVILGPLTEQYCLRSLMLGNGNPMIFFSRPVGNGLWILLLISIFAPSIYKKYIKKSSNVTILK